MPPTSTVPQSVIRFQRHAPRVEPGGRPGTGMAAQWLEGEERREESPMETEPSIWSCPAPPPTAMSMGVFISEQPNLLWALGVCTDLVNKENCQNGMALPKMGKRCSNQTKHESNSPNWGKAGHRCPPPRNWDCIWSKFDHFR